MSPKTDAEVRIKGVTPKPTTSGGTMWIVEAENDFRKFELKTTDTALGNQAAGSVGQTRWVRFTTQPGRPRANGSGNWPDSHWIEEFLPQPATAPQQTQMQTQSEAAPRPAGMSDSDKMRVTRLAAIERASRVLLDPHCVIPFSSANWVNLSEWIAQYANGGPDAVETSSKLIVVRPNGSTHEMAADEVAAEVEKHFGPVTPTEHHQPQKDDLPF